MVNENGFIYEDIGNALLEAALSVVTVSFEIDTTLAIRPERLSFIWMRRYVCVLRVRTVSYQFHSSPPMK